jgi:tol-pal system protein YbgF
MLGPRPNPCWTTALRLGAALALLLGAPSPPAGAELPALAGEIAALRVQLAGLRRVESAQATEPGRLAQYEVRLGQIEEELRRLTGRIEQLEHDQRTLEGRFDKLVGDLDQRLRALEQGAPTGAPLAAVAPEPRPGPGPAPGQTTVPPASNLGAPPQDLGQIPKSAVTALPRPAPPTVTPPPPATELPPQQQYDAAMELLRAGDYAGAETALQQFLDQHPKHELDPNAAYWLAETYYVRKNYAAAAAAFARNYRTYGKNNAKAPDNLLKLGMSLEGMGEKEKACLSYTELNKEFPDAPAHIQEAVARERARAECA